MKNSSSKILFVWFWSQIVYCGIEDTNHGAYCNFNIFKVSSATCTDIKRYTTETRNDNDYACGFAVCIYYLECCRSSFSSHISSDCVCRSKGTLFLKLTINYVITTSKFLTNISSCLGICRTLRIIAFSKIEFYLYSLRG